MKTNWPALRFSCLLLAGAAVTVLPASAQVAQLTATSAAAPLASISAVEVAQPGQQTTVRISGTGELHYQTSRLDSPPRLVLDFADTRLNVEKMKVPSDFTPVLDVRMGQPNPGQSRVVIDLAKLVPFSTQVTGSDITISFTSAAALVTPTALRPAKKPAPHRLAAVSVPNMPLPTWLTGTDIGFARPATQPAAPAPQNPPAVDSPAQTAVPAPEKKYTGDPISVNLKDVDLKDFFRLIHEISGLNVVLDPSVRGTVTLVLDEVPWDQGLDIVLRNNGLTKEIDGNVLRITTQDTLKREADQHRDLLKAQAESIEPVTVTRVLSYAQAPTMVVTLKKFLTARGDVFSDTRSNTLIIRDIPSSIPKIDNLLRQLDRKSQQVEIDARVVAASRSFARELGVQFGFSALAGSGVIGGLPGNALFTSPIIHPVTPPFAVAGSNSIPLSTNLGATAPNSGISFATGNSSYALDLIISAAESRGVGKLLSEPHGTIQNNQKLTVKQGTQVPIQTNINNTISVQYVDAVLRLEVTPQITVEGTVYMEIKVENTAIDNGIPLVQGIPALDTQSAETRVTVADGGTAVIGGVITSSQTTSINQTPILGSVPLIGHLFKHTSVNVKSQELLFFVTPRILPG